MGGAGRGTGGSRDVVAPQHPVGTNLQRPAFSLRVQLVQDPPLALRRLQQVDGRGAA